MEDFIYFCNGYSIEMEMHYNQKEYRNDIIVETNGRYYEVYFFTKDNLEYEMIGDGFFTMPGLIILDDITNTKIINSIKKLISLNYFSFYQGFTEFTANKTFDHLWYKNELKFDDSLMTKVQLS